MLAQVQKAMPPVVPLVPPPLPHDWKLQLIGEHNKENATLAALALRILGLSEDEIKNGLESFEPVEGRLQKVAEIKGVTFYNDNNATTPDATLAALSSFDIEHTILIAGGADKGLELSVLIEALKKCKKVLLLEGTGTDRIKNELENTSIYRSITGTLDDALAAAVPGDVILFSPAFASFGLFKNEYDRNDQFVAAIKQLR